MENISLPGPHNEEEITGLDTVDKIKRKLTDWNKSYAWLARESKVSIATISLILNRKSPISATVRQKLSTVFGEKI